MPPFLSVTAADKDTNYTAIGNINFFIFDFMKTVNVKVKVTISKVKNINLKSVLDLILQYFW